MVSEQVFWDRQVVISTFSGLVAGLVHVFSGPDHLAAIAPLSVGQRKQTWAIGFRWGLGHSSGVVLVGLLSLLLREILPMDLVSSCADRLMGVVLIGIGIWGIRKGLTHHLHTHEHTHQGQTHRHIHMHRRTTAHHHREPETHVHTHAAFAVGTLHGLAGSAHLLGILPALAFPTRTQAIGYLLAFSIGTIVAMMVFSSMIGQAARRSAFSGPLAYRALMFSCSAAAIGVGGYWLTA